MKKTIAAVVVLVLLLSVALGGTLAYVTTETTAENVITMGSVDLNVKQQAETADGGLAVAEDAIPVMPGKEVSRIISVENTGKGPAWVRVQLTPGFTLSQADAEPEPELMSLLGLDETHWQLKDGWYYYKEKLEPGAATEPLITGVSFSAEMDNRYQGAEATLTALVQATQVKNNGETVLQAAGWPEA